LPALPIGRHLEPRRPALVRPHREAQGLRSGKADRRSGAGAGSGHGGQAKRGALLRERWYGESQYRHGPIAPAAGGTDIGRGWTPSLHYRRSRPAGGSGVQPGSRQRPAQAPGGAATRMSRLWRISMPPA
jgi:hypothetical protein